MLPRTIQQWQSALQVKSFRNKFLIAFILLAGCAVTAPIVFQYIQQRQGHTLNDYLLNWLPSCNLSVLIFVLLYILILTGIVSLLQDPQRFLVALGAYVVLTVLRFISMLIVPLDPPAKLIELIDPFVQYVFYQQSVTKDLFFSGHVSLLIMLAITVPHTWVKRLLFSGACIVGFMLLLQHAHYTIDVLVAPFFSWLAVFLARKLL